jgi:hypothetical protein
MDVSLDVSRTHVARSPSAVRLSRLRHYQLPLYYVACFTVTWPLQVLVRRTGAHFNLNAGPSVLVPLTVAACGPSLAALAVIALLLGWGGVLRPLGQARSWHIHPGWYVRSLVVPTLILLAGVALFAACTHAIPHDWYWIQLPPWHWGGMLVPP